MHTLIVKSYMHMNEKVGKRNSSSDEDGWSEVRLGGGRLAMSDLNNIHLMLSRCITVTRLMKELLKSSCHTGERVFANTFLH